MFASRVEGSVLVVSRVPAIIFCSALWNSVKDRVK